MAGAVSKEAKRMCRMCYRQDVGTGLCQVESVQRQNELAETGECYGAHIAGKTSMSDHVRIERIVGKMVRLKNGDWIFQPY